MWGVKEFNYLVSLSQNFIKPDQYKILGCHGPQLLVKTQLGMTSSNMRRAVYNVHICDEHPYNSCRTDEPITKFWEWDILWKRVFQISFERHPFILLRRKGETWWWPPEFPISCENIAKQTQAAGCLHFTSLLGKNTKVEKSKNLNWKK